METYEAHTLIFSMINIVFSVLILFRIIYIGLVHFNDSAGLYDDKNKWFKLINDVSKLDIHSYVRDEAIDFLQNLIAELQKTNPQTAWMYYYSLHVSSVIIIYDLQDVLNHIGYHTQFSFPHLFPPFIYSCIAIWAILTLFLKIIDNRFSKRQNSEWIQFNLEWHRKYQYDLMIW